MSKTSGWFRAHGGSAALGTLAIVTCLGLSGRADAGVQFGPYASIKSTKAIKANKGKSTETETVKQREEYGLRGSISVFRLLKLQASVGQSVLKTTEKTQNAKDEYGQIDYEKDLNMSTDNPENEIKITETQRNGKVSVIVDPSFGFLILRAKAGVTATQRILVSEVTDQPSVTKTFGPTYKPHSGFGVGIKFSPKTYFIAEYNFEHYAFPEITPFEREVAVTFGVSL